MFTLAGLAPSGAERLLASFTAVLGQLPVATSVLDPDGCLVRVNAACCALLGRTEGELLGRTMAAVAAPGAPSAPDATAHDEQWQDEQWQDEQWQDEEHWLCAGRPPVDVVVGRLGVPGEQGRRWVLQQAVARPSDGSLVRAVGQAAALSRLWTDLTGLDTRDLGARTCDALVQRFGGVATLFVPDSVEARVLEAVAVRSAEPDAAAELSRLLALHPQQVDQGLVGGAMSGSGPLVVTGLAHDPHRARPAYRRWLEEHGSETVLVVPVRAGGEPVGVLVLTGDAGDVPLDQADAVLVGLIADRLAPALQRARHRDLERWTVRRSGGLAALGQACEEVLDTPRAVPPAAARAVSSAVDLPCLVWVADDLARRLGRFVLCDGRRYRAVTTWRSEHPDPLVDRVIEQGRLHVAHPDELAELTRPYTDLYEEPVLTPTSVVYGVRLTARGSVVGVLCVHDATGPLSQEQRRLVDVLAERTALLLDNAVLLSLATERGRQQEALAAIGAATLSAGLTELFDLAATTVGAVLEMPVCGVLQLQPDGAYVICTAVPGQAPRGTRLQPAPGDGLALVARTGQGVVVPDYRRTDVVDARETATERDVRSGALLPLRVDGQVWGVLTAHSAQPRHFAPSELDFLDAAASLLSGALQREAISDQQVHEATHDALTGLPNRLLLRRHLSRALGADGSTPVVGLLLLDLDDFKDVNDSLGHRTGDDVLTELAARLRAAVGPGPVLARLGGDEFAVCVTGCANELEVVGVADRVISAMAEPFTLPGLQVVLSWSTGVAVAPAHATDAGRLLSFAEMAMYRAKQARSGWALYDPALDRERAERLALVADLQAVLADEGLDVYYQPLVDLRSGEVVEAEALVRWQHPVRGLLGPGAFVPVAEATGLVQQLTLQVARQAAVQAETWRAQGTPCRVAVNVSPDVLRWPPVWQELRDVFTAAQGALTLEVTESALVDEGAQQALRGFAEAGISCAVDDFGSGYAALAGLRSLPVTRLKLDREFIAGVDADERSRLLVGGTVALAHSLGLDVVAEGVETEAVADVLRGLDVDFAQGYLWSHPVPAELLRLGSRAPVPAGAVAGAGGGPEGQEDEAGGGPVTV